MTTAAFDDADAHSVRAAPDLHRVAMIIVALPRVVSAGVAIHASRMSKYGNDRFESSRCTNVISLVFRRGRGLRLRRRYEREGSAEHRGQQKEWFASTSTHDQASSLHTQHRLVQFLHVPA